MSQQMTEAERYYQRKNNPVRRVAKALMYIGVALMILPLAMCGGLVAIATTQVAMEQSSK